MLSCHGQYGIRIGVKLFFRVGGMHQRQDCKHHPLVTGGQIVQKLLALLPLLLHVIGDDCGKIVVGVLFPLPVGDVGFHAQQTVLHLPHRFIRGDGYHVNAHHQVAAQIRKLRNHVVFDIGRILSEEKHTPVTVPHAEMVFFKLKAVRADKVLKAMPFFHGFRQIKPEAGFFPGTVEVMQRTQFIRCIHLHAFGA